MATTTAAPKTNNDMHCSNSSYLSPITWSGCCSCFGSTDEDIRHSYSQHDPAHQLQEKSQTILDHTPPPVQSSAGKAELGNTPVLVFADAPPVSNTHEGIKIEEIEMQGTERFPVRPAGNNSAGLSAVRPSTHDRAVVMHAHPQLTPHVATAVERPKTPPAAAVRDSPPLPPHSPPPVASPRVAASQKQLLTDIDNRVQSADGTLVDSQTVEFIIQQTVEAVSQCMLVTHWTSADIACLITLKSAAGSPGLALDHAGLSLASKSGSEAATVMSARSCAMFRRGLAQALEQTNAKLLLVGVQVKRFQVLREDLTFENGMVFNDGELNRRAILERYRHLVDDMFQHEARYPHKWMAEGLQGLQQDADSVGSSADGNSSTRPSAPSIQGYQQNSSASDSAQECKVHTPRSNNPYNNYASYPRDQPSPRQYSRESSPRMRDSPRKGQQQRLPQSVRMLSMDGVIGSSNITPRDRGR